MLYLKAGALGATHTIWRNSLVGVDAHITLKLESLYMHIFDVLVWVQCG